MKITFEKLMLLVLLVFWFTALGAISIFIFKWAWDNLLVNWRYENWIALDFVIFAFGVLAYFSLWFLLSIMIPWRISKFIKKPIKAEVTYHEH